MESITKRNNNQLMVLKPQEMWVIVYGKDKFYITNFERQAILDGIGRGLDVINVAGKVFTNKFLYILPSEYQDDSEHLSNGEWRCQYGKWHSIESECRCGVITEFDEERQVYVEKSR